MKRDQELITGLELNRRLEIVGTPICPRIHWQMDKLRREDATGRLAVWCVDNLHFPGCGEIRATTGVQVDAHEISPHSRRHGLRGIGKSFREDVHQSSSAVLAIVERLIDDY